MSDRTLEVLMTDLGMKAPVNRVVQPQPEHMRVLMLRAEGRRASDIAKRCGYSVDHVRTILRQPWFKEQLRDYIIAAGGDRLEKLFEYEAEDSLDTLVSLRDDNNVSSAIRAKCAIYIIDRVKGTPTQKVESTTTHRHVSEDPQQELSELDREIATAEAELNFRKGLN